MKNDILMQDSRPEELEKRLSNFALLESGEFQLLFTVGGKEAFREIVTEDRIVLAKAGEGFISVLVSERVHLCIWL